MVKKVVARIFRYDPTKDDKHRYETYEVPYEEGMTVLEALKYINEKCEPIAFRYECRFQECGQCGVMVNGRPVLSCKQRPEEEMTIDPLPIFPVIKDLVVNFDSFYRARSRLRPFLERTKFPTGLEKISYEMNSVFKEYATCIECFLCQCVCPVLKEHGKRFVGPLLMSYLARFANDPRDELDRVKIALSEGLLECTLCRKCDEVCPKGIEPSKLFIENLLNLIKK